VYLLNQNADYNGSINPHNCLLFATFKANFGILDFFFGHGFNINGEGNGSHVLISIGLLFILQLYMDNLMLLNI